MFDRTLWLSLAFSFIVAIPASADQLIPPPGTTAGSSSPMVVADADHLPDQEVKSSQSDIFSSSLLIARQPTPLRDTPPSGSFIVRKGDKIDEIETGTAWRILGLKRYDTLAGVDYWAEVAPAMQQAGSDPASGWVYFGQSEQSPNFQVQGTSPVMILKAAKSVN